MTAEPDFTRADVPAERRRLVGLSYRMLGTLAEAEDAVQETYARWYRLTDEERAAIGNPQGWLTRVASRICLDVLGSARVRRETYVGEWLPEPVPTGFLGDGASGDPLDRVALDDAVSSALLVVLEAMTPAERVAFTLHDVFGVPFSEISEILGRTPAAVRQLATSARRRVQTERDATVSRDEHAVVVAAFGRAAREGDLAGLVAVLDPRVVLRSDGGGFVSASRKPIEGADRVAVFIANLLAKEPLTVEERHTADGAGYVVVRDGRVTGVITFRVVADRVSDIWIVLSPEKLTAWT